MNRKIIKQGMKAYTITLPVDWIRDNNLDRGDEIRVDQIDNDIILSTGTEKFAEKKIEYTFTDDDILKTKNPFRLVQREYSALFKSGYDEIKFRSKNPKVIAYLAKRTALFIGYEVVEEGKDYVVVRSVVNPKKAEFESLYNRAFLVILTMSKQLIERLDKRNFDLKDLNELERTNGKVTDYLKRLLAKINIKDSKNSRYYYSIIAENERLCDEYKYLILRLMEAKKVQKETIDILEDLDETLRLLYKVLNKYDRSLIKEIAVRRDVLIAKIDRYVDKPKLDKHILFFQRNIIIRIYEMCEAMIEMNI